MTDLQKIDTDEVTEVNYMPQEQQPTPLTLGQFLEDMKRFPQDSEVYVSILGAGITIPIVEAITVDAKHTDDEQQKKLTLFLVPYICVRPAMQMIEERMQAVKEDLQE